MKKGSSENERMLVPKKVRIVSEIAGQEEIPPRRPDTPKPLDPIMAPPKPKPN